jgi:hypothetical protein
MMRKTLLVAVLGLSAVGFGAASTSYAADNPIASPTYNTPQQKKYFMEFCKIDLNSDGMVTMEEFLNHGNPLHPGYEKDPKLAKKLQMWKEMAGDAKEVGADKFVAYMDTHNPLATPSLKKQ